MLKRECGAESNGKLCASFPLGWHSVDAYELCFMLQDGYKLKMKFEEADPDNFIKMRDVDVQLTKDCFVVPKGCMNIGKQMGRCQVSSVGGSPSDVSEEPVTQEKRKKGWRMSCDVGHASKGLENEL